MIKKGDLYYPTKDFSKKAVLKDPNIYPQASKDPVKFWENLAKELFWRKKWRKGFEHNPPFFKWFLDGKINITENALDRNLKTKANKIAFIWEPEPIEEAPRKITFKELSKEVGKLANALKKLGVKKGDKVGIYLPMIPEIIISMLACARIGAIHNVVFSAFSPAALRIRLQETETKVLITADGYFRRGQVINLKDNAGNGILETKVEKVVVVKRAKNQVSWDDNKDIWYDDLIEKESEVCEAEAMDSENTLFVLYTSGSTGKPKGCVHSCGGYAVQANFTAKWIFDLKDTDVFWSTSDMGWITGHTYSCYAPLLNGVTFVIFEGAPDWPNPDRWAQIIEKYGVTIFYTAPTAIRMFEKYGAEIIRGYKFDSLRLLGSVGEPIDEAAWQWYFKEVGREKCPIVDTWWQTETGGILITSLPGIGPFKPAFSGRPLPGLKFDILNDKGRSCEKNQEGNLVLLPPFSPGLFRGIYKNPEKYLETYWSQYGKNIFFTSDAALKDENGLFRVLGRVDDVIKVAGHRVATGELEAAINSHPEVPECAVIGVPDPIKGETPLAFVISYSKKSLEELKKEIIDQIKKEIGPIALPKEVYVVEDLPKTRSGKIMRRILKKIYIKEELGDLSTLANPESVEKIKKVLETSN